VADDQGKPHRTRSEQNRRNRTTHGMSYHPLFKLVRYILRYEAVVPEWQEIRVLVEAIEAEAGPRPSRNWILVTKDDSGIFRPGNIEWAIRSGTRSTSAARLRAFNERLAAHGLRPAAIGDECDCWISDPCGRCPDPECLCPWEARIDCPCCVGIKTRMGTFHGDRHHGEDLTV
jgi:hypothetical protein